MGIRLWFLVLLAALLAACAPAQTPSPAPGPVPTQTSIPAASPAPTGPASGTGNSAPQAVLNAVLQDAVKRTGAKATDLAVSRAEARDWPDPGLGCPEAGKIYVQVITPGWLIELRGAGKVFEYHTNADGALLTLCQQRAYP